MGPQTWDHRHGTTDMLTRWCTTGNNSKLLVQMAYGEGEEGREWRGEGGNEEGGRGREGMRRERGREGEQVYSPCSLFPFPVSL